MLFECFEHTTSQKSLTAGALHNKPSGSILPAKVAQFLAATDRSRRAHLPRMCSAPGLGPAPAMLPRAPPVRYAGVLRRAWPVIFAIVKMVHLPCAECSGALPTARGGPPGVHLPAMRSAPASHRRVDPDVLPGALPGLYAGGVLPLPLAFVSGPAVRIHSPGARAFHGGRGNDRRSTMQCLSIGGPRGPKRRPELKGGSNLARLGKHLSARRY